MDCGIWAFLYLDRILSYNVINKVMSELSGGKQLLFQFRTILNVTLLYDFTLYKYESADW